MAEEKIKQRVFVIEVETPEVKTKRRLKAEIEPEIEVVPVLAVGVMVAGKTRVLIPLTLIEREDADALFTKYKVNKDEIVARVREIVEVEKKEKEYKLE